MQLEALSAHVIVDGKPLEEYDVVFENPKKATCWIASEEGKTFSVQWKCNEATRTKGTLGLVTVDGVSCGGMVMRLGSLGNGDVRTLSQIFGRNWSRNLQFSRIQLTDDDSLLRKQMPKHFGQIHLTIRRGMLHVEPRPDRNSFDPGDNKFHERSKKATVHCIGFGPEKTVHFPANQVSIAPNGEPELTFVFKYQSLDILQANGIVPRPATVDNATTTTLDNVDPSDLDDRIFNLENELKRLRDLKATDSGEDRKPKRIKREESSEQRRRPRAPASIEVIDLT